MASRGQPVERSKRAAPLAHDCPPDAEGWTGPKEVDGQTVEGTWRSHQVPVKDARGDASHRKILEDWLRSYRPEELFDEDGCLAPELAELAPGGERRMSANPHANGGELLSDLVLPDFRHYSVDVAKPGTGQTEATKVLGALLRDVIAANPKTFRLFGPDETDSNRLGEVFKVTAAPGTPRSSRSTRRSHPTGGSWRCSRSTSARAGWRATS